MKATTRTYKGRALVGPFPGSVSPVNGSGLYLRVSADTGDLCWAHFKANRYGGLGAWGLYADNEKRALQRKEKRSRKSLPWYGFAKSR